MALNQKAGQKASFEDLDNIPRLMAAYYLNTPDMDDPEQRVSFGTSGHRGTSLNGSFTESHIIAISQQLLSTVRSRVLQVLYSLVWILMLYQKQL